MIKCGYKFGGVDILTQRSDNKHNNTSWTLVYIKDGLGMYLLDSSLRCLNHGDMMILPPNVDYSFSSESLGDEYNENINAAVLRFEEAWLNDLVKVFPVMSPTILKIKEIRNPMVIRGPKWMRLSSLLDGLNISASSLLPIRIMDILDQISNPSDMTPIINVCNEDVLGIPQKIEMINRYISCNLANKITLEDLASYIKMSRTYLCLFFKNHFKEGFADYLNRKRIERACQYLTDGSKNISYIASECGFSTIPYFTRVFTKVMGTTPGKYRACHVVDKFV